MIHIMILSWDFSISEEQIYDAFLSYDNRKSCGSDGVPTFLYKKSAHIICKPLAIIFNHCITTSSFPILWKHAYVIPIPKVNNPTAYDLRPISLLPVPSKIFERLIFNSVSDLFYDNFDANQFGFRPSSSTCCALIKLHDHITKLLDSVAVSGVQVIALDYLKAFDSLIHKTIISKLLECGFPIEFVKLIFSYLQNRVQSVRIHNIISDPCKVSSGVPQGSIIGPSIFSLVMSGLKRVDSNTCMIKFADDLNLSIPIFHSVNHVASEIENVKNWSAEVGLNLIFLKCKYFFVRSTANSLPVPIPEFTFCHEIKLLGIIFSDDLRWDRHFSLIRTICNRRLYAIRTLKSILSVNELRNVYLSLIVSVMEYCSPLFIGINVKISNLVKNIERRFHNIICHYNCHCKILPDLTNRRILASKKLFLAASHPSHLLFCIIPDKRSRFLQPYSYSERRRRAFVPCTTEIVNSFIDR